jgi:hypothetical protein
MGNVTICSSCGNAVPDTKLNRIELFGEEYLICYNCGNSVKRPHDNNKN